MDSFFFWPRIAHSYRWLVLKVGWSSQLYQAVDVSPITVPYSLIAKRSDLHGRSKNYFFFVFISFSMLNLVWQRSLPYAYPHNQLPSWKKKNTVGIFFVCGEKREEKAGENIWSIKMCARNLLLFIRISSELSTTSIAFTNQIKNICTLYTKK